MWGFVSAFLGIVEWILNICNGGFNSFEEAVANLIGNIIGWFFSLGKVVTVLIDAIFGTNWTGGLENVVSQLQGIGKNDQAITLDKSAPQINYRFDMTDAYSKGYAWGAQKESDVKGWFNGFDIDSAYTTTGAGTVADNIASAADNTGKIADSVDITNENLKYLKDLAETEVINRFTTAEIKVEQTNHNNINSGLDIDGVVTQLNDGLNEAIELAAEGVHD